MQLAKRSTAASLIVGPVLDSTGAEYTGAVIGDLSIAKDDATTLTALASAATLTHLANGIYSLVLTTGNTDTLGRCKIVCTKSTYQCPPLELEILTATAFDTLVTNGTLASTTSGRTIVVDGSGLADANAVKVGPTGSGTAQTAANLGALLTGTGAVTFASLTVSGATTLTGALTATNASNSLQGVTLDGGSFAALAAAAGYATNTTSGALTFASIPTQSLTVTTNGAAVDVGATGIPVSVCCAVGSMTGTTPYVVAKLQEASTSGGTWADIAGQSPTEIDTANSVTTLVATNTKQWIRAVATLGGVGPTAQVTALIGRAYVLPANLPALAITAGGIAQADVQTIKTQAVTCSASVTVSPFVGSTGAAVNGTNANTLSGHDPGATLGTSTLTQTQVTGGAYALNSASFSFASALDFTTTQKTSIGTAVAASAVASVTGAVGSVTGNVGGNVTGSVGSVASGGITAASIAADAIGASELAADAVAEIAGAVWDLATSGHTTSGTFGAAMNAAGSAGDPLATSVPGAYGAGTAGYLIGTYLDAAVTSRMATYTQPTGFLAATFPLTVASTTNITAGTITTVTNLTNAPTSGDFTSTMKTSLNAATPASVVGNVGGIAGTTQTLDALQTALSSTHGSGSWATATGFATPTNITAASGVALTSAYDFAKGTVAMSEPSYPTGSTAPTPVQALYQVRAYLMNFDISGVDYVLKKLDGTDANTVTLNDASLPTGASL